MHLQLHQYHADSTRPLHDRHPPRCAQAASKAALAHENKLLLLKVVTTRYLSRHRSPWPYCPTQANFGGLVLTTASASFTTRVAVAATAYAIVDMAKFQAFSRAVAAAWSLSC